MHRKWTSSIGRKVEGIVLTRKVYSAKGSPTDWELGTADGWIRLKIRGAVNRDWWDYPHVDMTRDTAVQLKDALEELLNG